MNNSSKDDEKYSTLDFELDDKKDEIKDEVEEKMNCL